MNTQNKTVTPDALLMVAKELFIQVYPSRMPDDSDPQLLTKAAGYDRTAEAKYFAAEFVDFFNYLSDSMQKSGKL